MNNPYDGTNTVPTTEAGPPSDTTVGGQPPEANEADQPGTGVEQTTVDSSAPAPETRTWQPPMVMEMQYDGLPPELRQYPCCCWRYETRDASGRLAKVPYNPKTGARANTSDPSTFASFAEAVQAYRSGGYNGIGVGIFDNIAAIDIDHCIGDDGRLSPMAENIIKIMAAYTEVSPRLYRPKWDSPRGDGTYGSMTIQRALAGAGQYRAQRRAEQMAEAAALVATPVPIQVEDQQNTTAPDLAAAQAAAYVATDSPPVVQATQTIGSDGILAYQMGQQQAMLAQYQSISALDLSLANLPDVQYLVDGILPEGTSILAAPSKLGKSWLVLALGLAVAAGKTFMGRTTTQAGVLYLALEDSERRLQSRMRKILKSGLAPSNFYFMTAAPTLAGGLLDVIDAQIAQHPDVKLVIIDTLQMVRDAPRGKESPYATDYREMRELKNYMDSKGLSVLLVHHTRKMGDSDVYNMLSGTTGIMGAADTIWVVTKERRTAETATLCVTGRDVYQSESIVRFNEDDCMWEYVGSADQVAAEDAQAEYDNNPVVQAVRTLVDGSPGGVWRGLSSDIIAQMGGAGAAYTSQAVAKEILKFKDRLFEYDCIVYRANKSSGGCRHCFVVNEFSNSDPFAGPDEEDDTDTSAPSQPAE